MEFIVKEREGEEGEEGFHSDRIKLLSEQHSIYEMEHCSV